MLRRATHRILGNAAAAFDRAATLAAAATSSRARRRSAAESLGHAERVSALGALASAIDGVSGAGFFREPRRIDVAERRIRAVGDVDVRDLSWPTEHQVVMPDVAARYHRRGNDVAGARAFLHDEPRPVAICIHGYMGGAFAVEERVWPVAWLGKLGLDVVLFVLPFHGVRAEPGRRGPPPFPGADPRITIEGFRHAMADLRDLAAWLHHRGHPAVGVMGMSLGGYSTALAATLEPSLSFAIPIIPLASIADFARDQGRLGDGGARTAEQHAALERVFAPISPVHRAPAIDSGRVLVVAARADRITPVSHARRLAGHFGAELDVWHGGHLLQFGRSDGFRRIGRKLGELGVTPARPRGRRR